MIKFHGLRVFEGYAIGEIKVYIENNQVNKQVNCNSKIEIERFYEAREKTVNYLDNLYVNMKNKLSSDEAEIFNIHKLMAQDLDLEDMVKELINNNLNAEYAVLKAGESLSDIFNNMDNEYFRNRATDVLDVCNKIVQFLNSSNNEFVLEQPSIVLCKDIPASELVKLHKDYFLGLICTEGSTNSHVAIISRAMEVISIASVNIESIGDYEGKIGILDGCHGILIVDPDPETLSLYQTLKNNYDEDKKILKNLKNEQSITKDGHSIKTYANIASCYEVDNVLKNGGEGVGLFRSEFLYLEQSDYPSEDDQFIQYRTVVETLNPREVIIRTLDIGADKKVDYFDLPPEENPALGYRSIRICKDRPEVFLTQLKALYRASAYGNLSIMIPMIISKTEIEFVHNMCQIAMDNLKARNITYNAHMKVGIMIETPAAAIMADEFAKHVDFFSIGTNDLSQYTLAIDRQNSKLDKTFDPHHPAILRLIASVVKAAKKEGIFVGICGELARDELLVPFFVALGVDELSVSPPYILPLRKQIRELNASEIDLNSFIK